MSLESVVHKLIDVAAGVDRIAGPEVEALHNAVDGIEPAPAPAEPEPAAEPTADELAEYRAWKANQVTPAAAEGVNLDAPADA